jgi:hypothetical protein
MFPTFGFTPLDSAFAYSHFVFKKVNIRFKKLKNDHINMKNCFGWLL